MFENFSYRNKDTKNIKNKQQKTKLFSLKAELNNFFSKNINK